MRQGLQTAFCLCFVPFVPTSSFPASPSPAALTDDAQQAALEAHYHRVLNDMLDRASDMARLVHEQALAASAAGKPVDRAATAFDRIARCIRRIIMLSRVLDQPLAQRAAGKPPARPAEEAERPETPESVERLERLDRPDWTRGITDVPVPVAISGLCRDLGLAAAELAEPWAQQAQDSLAALAARIAAPTIGAPQPSRDPAGRAPPGWAGSAAGAADGATALLDPPFRGSG